MEEVRQDAAGLSSTERVSVQEAAEHLGTTVDAIRKRVQRDTIPHEKAPDGRVWVLLDTGRTEHDTDQDATGHRQDALLEAKDAAIADLRDRVEFLERELERRGEEANTLHRIVAGLTQANTTIAARLPELGVSQEVPEDAETVEEAPEGSKPRSDASGPQKGPQTGAQRPQGGGMRGLRRRLLGW